MVSNVQFVIEAAKSAKLPHARRRATGPFIMSVLIAVFGFYVLYPMLLIFINSFNAAGLNEPTRWSMSEWAAAFSQPEIGRALVNTFIIYFSYTAISFPIAVLTAWSLARTKVACSYGLEFMFWVSFMMPPIATTIGWTILLDGDFGILNRALAALPWFDSGPFEIYSVPGIIWVHLMANAISGKVMLLTPAFRNMNVALEEASRVSGGSNMFTMLRITLPVMIPAMTVVFMLDAVRLFNSFETEQILGTPIGFYIYSTKIYDLIRNFEPPLYGQATALASVTLLIIVAVIPLQRWLTERRQYTTVSGQFRPGLINLGALQPFVFVAIVALVGLLTVVPVLTLVGGSFMTRVGFFQVTPLFTLDHWIRVLREPMFVDALQTTLLLSGATAIVSPLIFSVVAYVLVRTKWPGRYLLDTILWVSAAIPGMLTGLGLLWVFLRTPGLTGLYGTIWGLLLVVILQGKLTSTQLVKGVYLQMGSDLEEAARVSGAGWLGAYVRIWLPLIMPTLVLIGTINFVLSAHATSSIILIASRETRTLSILALDLMTGGMVKELEAAGIVSLVIVALTVGVALVARRCGLPLSVRH
jgi:iron(III) transport system permease protein